MDSSLIDIAYAPLTVSEREVFATLIKILIALFRRDSSSLRPSHDNRGAKDNSRACNLKNVDPELGACSTEQQFLVRIWTPKIE